MSKPDFETLIIGAGFSGLGMAIRLKQNGFENFSLLERATDVGGVWRDNSYPGCACDVESHLYSFSFAPNPHWSRVFSTQKEIWDYLRDCAKQFGIYPHIQFGQEFVDAHWDEVNRFWRVTTSKGQWTAKFLITGLGAFSEPLTPDFPGLNTFQGMKFHSAQWEHGYDLKNKKVAVVGTGASSIQFVPEIQPLVQKLFLFQRTPAWILPRLDRPIEKKEQDLFEAVPLLQKASRLRYYLLRELFGITFRKKRWIGFGKKIALRHLKRAVQDPVLQQKLTPNYTIGCKRVLISNNYYPAVAQKNVEVVTESIREIRANSVVTADGIEHEVDALIFGTGFKVTEFSFAEHLYGKGRVSLSQKWAGSPRAFLGTTCHGFPNLFFLLGPNTGLGHNSVVLMIEAQIEHVIKVLSYLRSHHQSVLEPRADAEEEFIHRVDELSQGTVWLTGGCKSWYLDKTGRNSSLWPRSVGSFGRTVKPFRERDYEIS